MYYGTCRVCAYKASQHLLAKAFVKCTCVCVCVYKFARYTIHIVCLYRVSSLCVVSAECVCVCVCVCL